MFRGLLDFIRAHFDFKIYGVTLIAILVGLSIIPMLMYMPQKYGFENGLLENIQMGVLFIIMYLCLTSKVNVKFFRFAALALSLIIIREVNCGRTLFFPIPGEYHKYYSWKDLPNPYIGKIAHTLYGIWIGVVSIVFLKKKIYVDLWGMIKNIRIPFWNIAFACFAMFMGAIAEDLTHNNFIFEEGFELLFYVSLMGIVWLYSRNKNFILSENGEEVTDKNVD